jgi:hypothetical protein
MIGKGKLIIKNLKIKIDRIQSKFDLNWDHININLTTIFILSYII